MQTQKDKLGKVSITVEKDYWNINKDYDKLTVVEKEGIFGTFLSRKPVPAGTPLTNRTYWIPFSSLKEEIVIAYQQWVNKYGGIIESETAILNGIQQVMNDVYKHLPQGIYVEGNIDCIEQGSEDDLILNFGTTNNKNGDFSVYINNILYGTYKNIKDKELTLNIHEDTVVRIECTQNGYTFIGSWNVACLYPSYIGYGLTYEDVLENDDLKIDTKIDITGFYSVIANVEDGFIFICVPKDKLVSNILMNGYNIPMEEPVIVRNSENIEYKIYKSINSYELKDYTIYIGDYVDDTKTKLDEVLTRLNQIDGLEGNGEDINTNNNNQLQFADRQCNEHNPNGMGYVILRKDRTFAEQIADKPNTIFEIRYNFDLNGEEVAIPVDSVLYFIGGCLKNGIIIGNKTIIDANSNKIFDNITLQGTFGISYLRPEWFGAKGDGVNDDYESFQKTILSASRTQSNILQVLLTNNKTYNISKHLNLYPCVQLVGDYLSYDKTYDSRNRAKIVVTENDDAIRIVTQDGLGDSCGMNVIQNIAIIGTTAFANRGIFYEGNTALFIEKIRIVGVFISHFKYGIFIDAQQVGASYPVVNGCIIDNLSIQKNVGIGIYIKIHDIYGLDIKNSHIYYPYIFGIIIDTNVITTPINILDCVLEGCGNQYNLIDYNTFGCGAISVKSNSDTECVNVIRCYMEANAPLRNNDGSYDAEVESVSDDIIYVSNPNWDKTAGIIIDGPQLNIRQCICNELYQLIAINNSGRLSWSDNIIYVMGLNTQLNMFTNNIVRVKDLTHNCANISISIDLSNIQKNFYEHNTIIGQINEIGVASGTNVQSLNVDINIPFLDRQYSFAVNSGKTYYKTNELYFDSNANDGGNGLVYAPFKYFDSLLTNLNLIYKPGDTVTVYLKSSVTLNQYVGNTKIRSGINVIFVGVGNSISFILNKSLYCESSTIVFINVSLTKGTSFIEINNSKICFKSCGLTFSNSNTEFVKGIGQNVISVDSCTITTSSQGTHFFNSINGQTTVYIEDTTVPSNVVVGSSLQSGLSSDVPSAYASGVGTRYFMTDKKRPVYSDGTNWVESDGIKNTIKRYGSTSQRPAIADVYDGFRYFDTTLQMDIIAHNGKWVDSNGQTPGKHSGEFADLPDFLSGTAGANDDGYQFTFTDDTTYGDKTVWWNSNAGNGGAWVDANGTVIITNP